MAAGQKWKYFCTEKLYFPKTFPAKDCSGWPELLLNNESKTSAPKQNPFLTLRLKLYLNPLP